LDFEIAEAVGSGWYVFKPPATGWKIPEPKLIGLAGPARVGKDTVANLLVKAFPAKAVAFADPIRSMLAAGFGFGQEHFNGPLKEQPIDWIGKSYRQMAQTLGTEWGRHCVNEQLWVLRAYEKVKEFHSQGFHAVITDVRFPNEAEFVRSKGGVIWHIRREGIQAVSAHASEAGVEFKPGDVYIDNNGSLDNLLDEVCDKF
jgi:hypothetical protein